MNQSLNKRSAPPPCARDIFFPKYRFARPGG